jgi:pyruvate kinase
MTMTLSGKKLKKLQKYEGEMKIMVCRRTERTEEDTHRRITIFQFAKSTPKSYSELKMKEFLSETTFGLKLEARNECYCENIQFLFFQFTAGLMGVQALSLS